MQTCALVAASDFNAVHFCGHEFDYIVAVDGGLAHLESVECEPDYILGDFDSLGYVPEGANVEKHPVHKDKSDLELALDFALDRGLGEIVVYGALGGRLDHSVANLQMCARFAEEGMGMTLVGSDCAVRILVGPGEFELPLLDEGTVSVFSATDESLGVTEWGMEYLLEDACLTNRTTLGLSNELTGKPAGVAIDRGTLYIFYPLSV